MSFYLELKVSSFISLEIGFAPDLLAAPMPTARGEHEICVWIAWLLLCPPLPVLVLGDLDADAHGRDWKCTWSSCTALPQTWPRRQPLPVSMQPVVGHNCFTKPCWLLCEMCWTLGAPNTGNMIHYWRHPSEDTESQWRRGNALDFLFSKHSVIQWPR